NGCILDTGIPLGIYPNDESDSLSHPDLSNPERYILGPNTADPGSSVKDDRSGHGTHVTGIIAAETNNGTGIAGITWNSRVLVIKVFGGPIGTIDAIGDGIIAAVDSNVQVIQCSGGERLANIPSNLEIAVRYAHESGILQIYSAGNAQDDGVAYPALFAFKGSSPYQNGYSSVLSIAATDHNDDRSYYSSYNPTEINISVAAPGGFNFSEEDSRNIYSTFTGYRDPRQDTAYHLYKKLSINCFPCDVDTFMIPCSTNTYLDEWFDIGGRPPWDFVKYWVKAEDISDQESTPSNSKKTKGQSGIQWRQEAEIASAIPKVYNLSVNSPNPFNPTTTIRYDLPEVSYVSLVIYDILGREIRTLLDSREEAGFKSVVWDGKDNRGNIASAGIYIYALRAWSQENEKTYHKTRKMVLLR
ncbi:MAG: S8 family serine peptidase, partial [Fidelibacterota bacterium]